jgi:hypothetical protein
MSERAVHHGAESREPDRVVRALAQLVRDRYQGEQARGDNVVAFRGRPSESAPVPRPTPPQAPSS